MPYFPLLMHCLIIGFIQIAVMLILNHFKLFAPDKTGFWIWVAFSLSLLINPSVTLYSGDFSNYDHYTWGSLIDESRMYWVLILAVTGIATFYIAYLTTRPWKYKPSATPLSHTTMIVVLLIFLAIGWNSILKYRLAEITHPAMGRGKSTGNLSGWQTDTHGFVIFPCLLFIAMKRYRIAGILMTIVYILVRLNDKSDRFSVVAVPLAAALFYMIEQRRRWPPLLHCAIAVTLLLFLVARGHTSTSEFSSSEINLGKVVNTAFIRIGTGADTSMLPTFYRETELVEKHGFTYGANIIQELFLAPLPRPAFPWKDDVFSFIPGVKYRNDDLFPDLYGAKSTIICAFYGYGGYIGILIGMTFLGWLLRKMDGLLNRETPIIARTWAIMILASLWMAALGTLEWWYKMVMMWSLPMFACVIINRLVTGGLRSTYFKQSPKAIV